MSDGGSALCGFVGTDYLNFSSKMPAASPATPFLIPADRSYRRKVFTSGKVVMPDGVAVGHWGFEDENGVQSLPSPVIRAKEGEVVHVLMEASKKNHTIHHHGIEPDAFNDGVGHTSFEADRYTYQWRPHTPDAHGNPDPDVGKAGSYFYHCHVNTVLHVQMGLVGPMIIDPQEGPGVAYHNGPRYDIERYWAAFGLDPYWRALDHAAGLDGADAGLNIFRPEYFMVNNQPDSGTDTSKTLTDGTVAIRDAKVGQTILIRLLNASYYPQLLSLGGLEKFTKVIASDGRPFPKDSSGNRHVPFSEFTGGGLLEITGAERYDLFIDLKNAPSGVEYRVTWDIRHWITGAPVRGRLLKNRPLQTLVRVT